VLVVKVHPVAVLAVGYHARSALGVESKAEEIAKTPKAGRQTLKKVATLEKQAASASARLGTPNITVMPMYLLPAKKAQRPEHHHSRPRAGHPTGIEFTETAEPCAPMDCSPQPFLGRDLGRLLRPNVAGT
jgi:hypothetical protein